MQERHNSFNMHKMIKEMTQKQRSQTPGALEDAAKNILLDTKEKLTRLKEYIEQLFEDNRSEMPEQEPAVKGEKTEVKEVVEAIQNLKNREAIEPDELHGEVLEMPLKDKDTLVTMAKFFNKIYDRGVLPQDWLKSNFVTLPKKLNS